MSHATCIDPRTLERYLGEELDGDEEAVVVDHIDTCGHCQQALERLAAHGDAWEDVKYHLGDHDDLSPHDDTLPVAERDRLRELERLQAILAPTDDPDMLGRLGSYEVCGIVGHGSTGVVVKALEPRLNRYVAIKILSPTFCSNGPARVRFEREGRAIAAVTHEHVVPIYAVDEHRGLPYIVMQYVPGGSLQQRIDREGPLSTCEVTRIGMQIARGLSAAHAQGIVHRDVKPANVMLESSVDRAMVTDFGLARVADEAAMTRSGVISGTPQYMSPEQARGDAADPRSDLFSLGSVMYTACTGHAPFRSETVFGVIKRVCDTEPRPIRELNSAIEDWLVALIAKLHAKNTPERFESADAVADILARELAYMQSPTFTAKPHRPWVTPRPAARRTRRIGIAIAAAVAGLAVLGFALWPGKDKKDRDTATLAATPQPASPEAAMSPLAVKVAPKPADARPAARRPRALTPQPPLEPGKMITVERNFEDSAIDGYTLYLPPSHAQADKPLPMIVYLAGGQTVGGKVEQVNGCGIPDLLQEEPGELPAELESIIRDTFIVASPHLSEGNKRYRQYYKEESAIRSIVDDVISEHHADPSRIYLTGAGRGGHGTWGLATRMSDVFAAFAPVSGEGHGIEDHESLMTLPLWATHNTRDGCVDYVETVRTVQRIESVGGEPFLRTLMEDTSDVPFMDHDQIFVTIDNEKTSDSNDVYENPDLYRWLLRYRLRTRKLFDKPQAPSHESSAESAPGR